MHMKQQAFNPFLPSWEYVPDGEPYLFGDRVYVYGSHDFFGGDVYCMGDYVCWSTPEDNLGDWRYEGVIYRKDQDPHNTDLQRNLYAPDVTIGPDGRYYLYYVLSTWGVVSVAVADRPAGPYEFFPDLLCYDFHILAYVSSRRSVPGSFPLILPAANAAAAAPVTVGINRERSTFHAI